MTSVLTRSQSIGNVKPCQPLSAIPEHSTGTTRRISSSDHRNWQRSTNFAAASTSRLPLKDGTNQTDQSLSGDELKRSISTPLFRRMTVAAPVTRIPPPSSSASSPCLGTAAPNASPSASGKRDSARFPPTPPASPQPSISSSSPDKSDKSALHSKARSLYQQASQQNLKSSEGLGKARRMYLASYDLFAQVNDPVRSKKAAWKVANLTADLGYRAAKKKEFARAHKLFLEARSIFQRLCELNKEATCLQQLGLVHIAMGESTTAADYLRNATAVFIEAGNTQQEASSLCELANLLTKTDPSSSILYFKQALMLFCKLGDSLKEARTLFSIAKLCSIKREYATSFAYYLQARVIFRRLGEKSGEFLVADADCSYALGKLAARGELFPAAVTYLEEATILYRESSQSIDEAWALYRLALVMLRCGDSSLAIDYLLDAKEIFEKFGQGEAQGSCCIRLGEILRDKNEKERARGFFEEASQFIDVTYNDQGKRQTRMLRKSDAHFSPIEGERSNSSRGNSDVASSTSASPLSASKSWWTPASASVSALTISTGLVSGVEELKE